MRQQAAADDHAAQQVDPNRRLDLRDRKLFDRTEATPPGGMDKTVEMRLFADAAEACLKRAQIIQIDNLCLEIIVLQCIDLATAADAGDRIALLQQAS